VNGQILNTGVLTGQDSGHLDPIFDPSSVQADFAIGTQLAQQASTFIGYKTTEAQRANEKLEAGVIAGADAATIQADQDALNQMKTWMPGGTSLRVFSALTGGLGGNMGGSLGGVFLGAAVSYIQGAGAAEVKQLLSTLPQDAATEGLRAGLQGILGCAAGAATGGSCASGALGGIGLCRGGRSGESGLGRKYRQS